MPAGKTVIFLSAACLIGGLANSSQIDVHSTFNELAWIGQCGCLNLNLNLLSGFS